MRSLNLGVFVRTVGVCYLDARIQRVFVCRQHHIIEISVLSLAHRHAIFALSALNMGWLMLLTKFPRTHTLSAGDFIRMCVLVRYHTHALL